MAENDIKGRVVLITGAAGDLGAAMVRKFLDGGAKHVAALDLSKEAGAKLETDLNEIYGKKVKFYPCDVTKDEELFKAFDKTVEDHGYVDVVINNAGIMNDSEHVYKKEIEVNVTALVSNTLKAFKSMRKDEGGRGGTIVNISSIAALVLDPSLPIYSATKSAVLHFSNSLGKTFPLTGVRILTICFGPTDTSLFDVKKLGAYDKGMDKMLKDKDVLNQLLYFQSIESATKGVMHAYQKSKTGGTWLIANDLDPEDISGDLDDAYNILANKYRKGKEIATENRVS